jgi:hypothetical protein
VRGQRHALAAPYPPERPGTHCTGAWVGLRAGAENLAPPLGFDPRTVQPVGSRYTDYAIRPTTNLLLTDSNRSRIADSCFIRARKYFARLLNYSSHLLCLFTFDLPNGVISVHFCIYVFLPIFELAWPS